MGKPSIPPEANKLFDAAESARLKGDHPQAATLYQQLSVALSANPALKAFAISANAWAALSRGIVALSSDKGHFAAKPIFESAHKQFVEANNFLGSLRAEAGLSLCQAMEAVGETEFETAIEFYAKAKGCLQVLADRVPAEAAAIRLILLEFDLEIALCDLLSDAEEDDFDGARSALGDARRVHQSIIQLATHDDHKAFFNSYLSMADGLIPLVRGRQDLARFKLGDAKTYLQEAGDKMTNAVRILEGVATKPAKWKATEHLYKGIVQECKARIAHCEVFDSILAGQLLPGAKRLRETAQLYHLASEAFADSGPLGYGGLYATAGERDTLKALADALEAKVGKEFEDLPDFASFVSNAMLAGVLARDYRELLSSYVVGSWKLCLVGVGSVLEALLLDRIQAKWPDVVRKCGLSPAATPAQASGWRLEEMIEHSETAGLITKGNKYISDALRDHRNLVHPAKELRGKYTVDGRTALASIRALHVVIQDLKRP